MEEAPLLHRLACCTTIRVPDRRFPLDKFSLVLSPVWCHRCDNGFWPRTQETLASVTSAAWFHGVTNWQVEKRVYNPTVAAAADFIIDIKVCHHCQLPPRPCMPASMSAYDPPTGVLLPIFFSAVLSPQRLIQC